MYVFCIRRQILPHIIADSFFAIRLPRKLSLPLSRKWLALEDQQIERSNANLLTLVVSQRQTSP
jgi:hypothetical protein